MKKVGLIVGTIVILSSILSYCIVTSEKMYTKKEHFSTPEEIVNVLNSSTLSIYKEGTGIIYSDQFYECLSKRKRITSPLISWKSVELKLGDKNSEEDKKKAIDLYTTEVQRMGKYKLADYIDSVNLTGTCIDSFNPNVKRNVDINLILIEEGEGLVIDGIFFNYNDGNENYGDVKETYEGEYYASN